MAKVKLTRSQMAFAAGESIADFEKRTKGKDPTEGVVLRGESDFFPQPGDDKDDMLLDDEPAAPASNRASNRANNAANEEPDESEYLPDGPDDDSEVEDDSELEDDSDSDSESDADSEAKPAARKKVAIPDWAEKEDRDFAASYGLSDADLDTFKSADDLRRYGRLTDKRIAKQASKQEGGDSQGKVQGDTQGKVESALLDRLKPLDRQRYVDAKYGDEEMQLVDGLNATIEAVRQVLPQLQQQQDSQRHESERREAEEFNKTLDELNPNAFGKAVVNGKISELSDGFRNNRLKVHEAMEQIANGIAEEQQQQGKEVKIPSISMLAKRAAAMVFGEADMGGYVEDSPGKARPGVDEIIRQSRKRRPTSSVGKRGGSSGTAAGGVKSDPRSIASNPMLRKFWKQTQRENGAE